MEIPDEAKSNSNDSSFITVLITTFSTIFVAELGDKTQIATLMFSAQSGEPTIVFIGAATALIFSSLIGVLLGRWLSNNLPDRTFKISAGILMVSVGVFYSLQAIKEFYIYKDLI